MSEKGRELEDPKWVTDYITEWIEKNTKFKVKNLELEDSA